MENITSKGTIFGTLIAQAGPKGDTGKTGDRGLTGEAGYSPVKGIDYFTQEDISEIRKGIEGDLTGEYNKNAIEKTNIFNTNAKETTTSFDLNAENKTKEYNDNALAEIEKYNSNAIEKSNNFDTNFENKTSKFDSNYDEKTKEFNDNNDLGIQNYNNNAKKQMEIFDTNFTERLEAFNNNAGTKFNGFNANSDKAFAEYNKNHTAKMKEFDDDYDTKTKTFDDNAAAKLEAYNKNDKTKTDAYNNNASNKEETFNTNAADKQNEFDENASDKLAEYNQNAKELINKVEQVQAENETLKAENKLIKEQIPSASASGNSVHIEDSGTLDFDWKIKGGHRQETREGYNLLDFNVTQNSKVTVNEDGTLTINGAGGFSLNIDKLQLKAGITYYQKVELISGSISGANINNTFLSFAGAGKWISSEIFTESSFNEDTEKTVIWINASATFDNAVIKIWANTNKSDFEQYGASPSPDYPSEIETVGSNVNILNYNNLTAAAQSAGYVIDESGNVYHQEHVGDARNWNYSNSNYTLELGKGSYMLSIYFSKQTSNKNSQIVIYKEDSTSIKITKLNDISNIKIEFNLQETQKIGLMIKTFEGVYKIKLEKGSTATPYSPFGMGSVETDVVNKNLLDKNNEKKGITINTAGVEEASGARSTTQYITVDKNKKVLYVNWSGKTGKQNPGYTILLSYDSNKKLITRQPKYNETSSKNWTFDISNASFIRVTYEDLQVNNGEYGVENTIISYEKTEYEEHQSQTAIMPIQQEMLEGDYVADVEHHEWKKIVLDGEKYGCIYMFPNGRFSIVDLINKKSLQDCKPPEDWALAEPQNICCTHLPTVSSANQTNLNMFGIANITSGEIRVKLDNATEETNTWTAETINTYLKQQYEAGTPVTIYYKLVTPVDLELTEEQKAVRDTKLYTYKNITNISVSDELASIDVNYKKDPTTEHDDLQNQIDEIKQLISTTETSALLLDNLQKDAESEVE